MWSMGGSGGLTGGRHVGGTTVDGRHVGGAATVDAPTFESDAAASTEEVVRLRDALQKIQVIWSTRNWNVNEV